MKRLVDVTGEEARRHFLKGSSYFNNDLPKHLSFQPIIDGVASVLGGKGYASFERDSPKKLSDVNYSFIANKDGRFAWRPLELIHPAIYVALVDVICEAGNWSMLTDRLRSYEGGLVECCSAR